LWLVADRVDFFVSYTGADQAWAEWVAWQVRELGLSVVLQAWDFEVGSSFVAQMDEALRCSERVLVVLSERYLHSRFGQEEWHAKYAEGAGLVVPVRIDDVTPPGLLAPTIYVDLFGKDEAAAVAELTRRLTQKGPPATGIR
jgi:hypothetical protein